MISLIKTKISKELLSFTQNITKNLFRLEQ